MGELGGITTSLATVALRVLVALNAAAMRFARLFSRDRRSRRAFYPELGQDRGHVIYLQPKGSILSRRRRA